MAGFFVVIAFGVGLIAEAASSEINLEPGDASITVRNNGKAQHDFTVTGLAGTRMLDPGAEETIPPTGLEWGTYDFICSVPGHADGGMKGTITVAEGDGTERASAGGDMDHSAHASMSPQEMLAADAARTALFPAETKSTGGRPLEPRIEADGTKVFELTAEAPEG